MLTGGELDTIIRTAEVGAFLLAIYTLVFKMGKHSQKIDNSILVVTELKAEIKELKNVVTAVALQSERLNNMSERMNTLERKIDGVSRAA